MFKLLTTFRVAYETRNFSKTAEILFISQPAVSNQMKQLEEEMACVLFKRKGKQEMHPTKAADTLYLRVLNLKDDWDETLRMVKASEAEQTICRMSASNTFSVYYLPELMSYLIQRFPNVLFELEMKNSEEVLKEITGHHIDFGFIEMPLITDGVSRIEIARDELVLVGDMESELWLSRESTSGVFHYMEKYLLSQNIKPRRMLVRNNEMIIKLVEEGVGKSMISRRGVPNSLTPVKLGKDFLRPLYFLKKHHISQDDLLEIAGEIEIFYKNKKTEA